MPRVHRHERLFERCATRRMVRVLPAAVPSSTAITAHLGDKTVTAVACFVFQYGVKGTSPTIVACSAPCRAGDVGHNGCVGAQHPAHRAMPSSGNATEPLYHTVSYCCRGGLHGLAPAGCRQPHIRCCRIFMTTVSASRAFIYGSHGATTLTKLFIVPYE